MNDTLKLQVLEKTHMSSDGAQVLRSIQNDSTDNLDLFVRESIQNSLDAAKYENAPVMIDFSHGKFNHYLFCEEIKEAKGRLREKFGTEYQEFLMISDKNTHGLTGTLSHEDDKMGNFMKLVYSIGKPQDKDGAGGSWGYGKTVYFRLGIGLVVYYSRIEKDSYGFEERLVISLIEDQNKKDTVLSYPKGRKTGIAWWGDLGENQVSLPITDSKRIQEILGYFNIKGFEKEETGTKIIIPYINKDELLSLLTDDERAEYRNDLLEYIKILVQRWYAPRLNNPDYKYGLKNNLLVSLNGTEINMSDENHFFRVIKAMYQYSFDENESVFDGLINKSEKPKIERINQIIDNKKIIVGKFVYSSFYYEDLGMSVPESKRNPFFYTKTNMEYSDSNTNRPIVLYTRQPGMIINYETASEWVNGVSETPKDTYLIGFFVLNSDNATRISNSKENYTLENYVRSTENADHMGWVDKPYINKKGKNTPTNIIFKIKNNVSNKLKQEMKSSEKIVKTTISEHLSHLLGGRIMPEQGFGNKPKEGTEKRNIPEYSRKKKKKAFDADIIYDEITYVNKRMSIPFTVSFHDIFSNEIKVELKIDSDNKPYSILEYEENMNNRSPIRIYSFKINRPNSYLDIKSTYNYETNYLGIVKGPFNKGQKIMGEILLEYDHMNLMPIIIIEENEVEKEKRGIENE